MIDLVSPKNALFVLVWTPTAPVPPFAGDRDGGNKGEEGGKMDDLEGSGGGKGGGIGRGDEALGAYLKEMTRTWLYTIQVCVCVRARVRVSGW